MGNTSYTKEPTSLEDMAVEETVSESVNEVVASSVITEELEAKCDTDAQVVNEAVPAQAVADSNGTRI